MARPCHRRLFGHRTAVRADVWLRAFWSGDESVVEDRHEGQGGGRGSEEVITLALMVVRAKLELAQSPPPRGGWGDDSPPFISGTMHRSGR